MGRITILDSTLRDGAQGEGISFSVKDKLKIVEALDELGVDLIEAGNPGSNPKDLEFFRESKRIRLSRAELVAFGSTRKKGMAPKEDQILKGLLDAGTKRVVIFGKSWDFHVREVIKASLEENLAMIRETCSFLRDEGRAVVYDAEHFFDGWEANPEYAMRTLAAAKEGGAEALVLCDTNGGSLVDRVGELTALVVKEFGIPVGIHTHNDSGLAVANSLAAVKAGAVHVQGTLVGFGERCGNANLSTICADLILKMKCPCLADDALPKLTSIVRLVAEVANVTLDEGMPYVGLKAFAHKAGMHIDAVSKNTASCEHVSPEKVGNERRFLMSEVAGRSLIVERISKIDPTVTRDSPVTAEIVKKLKELEQQGYQFEGADGSFELLVRKAVGKYKPFFELKHFRSIAQQPSSEGESKAQAIVKVLVDGQTEITAGEGDGPVNALDIALRKALERFYPALKAVRLSDFKVRVLNSADATAAKVRVLIESTDGSDAWTTVGVSTDVIEASWIALVDSIEYKLIKDIEKRFKAYI